MLSRGLGRATLAIVVVTLVATLLQGGSLEAQRLPELIQSVPEAALGAATVSLPDAGDVRYRRSRHVLLDVDQLRAARPGHRARFQVFPDRSLVVVLDEVIASGRDQQSYVGHVDGAPLSSVVLERVDGVVVGRVQVAGDTYAVRYAGGGLSTVHEVDPAAFAVPDRPLEVPVRFPGAVDGGEPAAKRKRQKFFYVALFTKAAKKAQGGRKALRATAKLTVTWINKALRSQKVKHRVKFKGLKPVKGADSGDLSTALQAVTAVDDGVYDRAQKHRDRKNADFVGLYIVGDGTGYGACGLGWRPFTVSATNAPYMYSAVREDCNVVGGGKTGAHELLHNMSGCHPVFGGVPACEQPAFRFAFGKVVKGDAHTTLGTGAVCPRCADLMTVSGKKRFQGSKVGGPRANIARLVNRGAAIHSAYR